MIDADHPRPPMTRRIVLVLLGTLLLNTVIAVALTAAGGHGRFMEHLLHSQVIGFTISAACWSVTPWVERTEGALHVAVPLYAAAIALGVPGGILLASQATEALFPGTLPPGNHLVSAQTAVFSVAIAAAGTLWFYMRHRVRHARLRIETESWRAIAAERSAAQAQLQALRAQVEPHFLFNTLANVSALIDRDPAAARALVDDLARHLRATLRHARAGTCTLGEELEVTGSLLAIMKRRLGDRLQWRFDVPDALRAVVLPPMLVQPLVENAVKHGIEPQPGGGEIVLRAERDENGRLSIEVADTGLGLVTDAAPSADGGTGLANLQARLRAILGPDARLSLHDNAPRGTVARLVLPLPAADGAPAR
ncbi:MAG: hypothetical protein RJA99_2100 [Pseudomonadota bacterium]|jgi:hypothetical protein